MLNGRKTDLALLTIIVLLGTWLRLWGLGNLGLFADEELMAMPTIAILESGLPTMPSGVLYSRAPLQLYLMAASVKAFGHSEWALRLPSVIAGILLIPLSFKLARRFLTVDWSLVVALLIALSPPLIAQSQTARMYVFYQLTSVLFCIAVFEWERSQRTTHLLLALLVYLVGLQFIELTVFISPLLLFPGLHGNSRRMLAIGGTAFAGCVLAQFFWEDFSKVIEEALGFQRVTTPFLYSPRTEVDALSLLVGARPLAFSLTVVGLAIAWWLATRALRPDWRDWQALAAVASLFVAVAAAASLHHHIGAVALVCGAVLYLRAEGKGRWLALLIFVVALTALMQYLFLHSSAAYEQPRQIIGAVLGQPSPLPYLRFASFFPLAVAIYAVVGLYFLAQISRRRPVPDHLLFLVLAVWVPIFLIGFFQRDSPLRYVSGEIVFFTLGAVAGIRAAWSRFGDRFVHRRFLAVCATLLLIPAFVRPTWFLLEVNPKHSDFPLPSVLHRGADHKSAAEFVRGLTLSPGDLLIAEDVYQQTYLLGGVDYWLRSFGAGHYSIETERGYEEIFTGTLQLGTAELLTEVLGRKDRGDIYLIGSGETTFLPTYYLGEDILAVLENAAPEVLYVGKDGETTVRRIAAPHREASGDEP